MKFFLCIVVSTFLGAHLYAADPYIGYSDYQIVTDTRFDAAPYFERMQSDGVNLQRIWVLGYSNTGSFREQMPFRKEGKKYDLNELDSSYLERLRSTLAEAQRRGQTVMLTLFDRWSMASAANFSRTPWYYKNNTDKLLTDPFPEFYDLSYPKLVSVQKSLVQEIVRATAEFHPIYEIMNEARWQQDCRILADFHDQVAQWILEIDPNARIAVNIIGNCPSIYKQEWVSLISFHAYDWRDHGICETIEQYRDLGKQILIDTDGAFKERVDNKLLRKWLQETLTCGASFNHKDDIYYLDKEALAIFREERELLAAKTQNLRGSESE